MRFEELIDSLGVIDAPPICDWRDGDFMINKETGDVCVYGMQFVDHIYKRVSPPLIVILGREKVVGFIKEQIAKRYHWGGRP